MPRSELDISLATTSSNSTRPPRPVLSSPVVSPSARTTSSLSVTPPPSTAACPAPSTTCTTATGLPSVNPCLSSPSPAVQTRRLRRSPTVRSSAPALCRLLSSPLCPMASPRSLPPLSVSPSARSATAKSSRAAPLARR